MLSLHDTIVAIATPPGRGGVGIVRLSGPEALALAETLFAGKRKLAEHPFVALRGVFADPETGETVDDGLAVFFRAPRSFTGEDVVELHAHGAPVVLQRLIQLALRHGARTALPGEFTMRAVINRRIDLAQAEGIRDLIDAQTTYQAQLAASQARGALSTRLQPAKEELLHTIVHLESSVEFVEENLDTDSRVRIGEQLTRLAADLDGLRATFRAGRVIRQGLNLAVIGRPNVGKSSLFNALLDADRAIVTDIPGTTRDTLTETAAIADIPVRLVDTAGIRETDDVVERLGVERTFAALADADLILLVTDAARGVTPEDDRLLAETAGRLALLVVNKTDLADDLTPFQNWLEEKGSNLPIVGVSARERRCLDDLRARIRHAVAGDAADSRPDLLVTDARHAELLHETVEALVRARDALDAGYSEEVPLADLHRALDALGEITGEVTIEGIFDRIFATFCVGK
jgi:tRNA modification GTPase